MKKQIPSGILTLALSLGSFYAVAQNVGVGTIAPGSTLDVKGSLAGQYTKVTATTTTLTVNDYYVVFAGTAAGTITLPQSTVTPVIKGRMYFIKNTTASFNVTIRPTGTETIDGSSSIVLHPGNSLLVINSGLTGANATWEVINLSTTTQPVTTASNGLTAASGNVKLGGQLSAATTVDMNGNDVIFSNGGNLGINTATVPGTSLDVGGAITNREVAIVVTGTNAATVSDDVGFVRLAGTATANITITAAAPNAGKRLIIFHGAAGGFSATLGGFVIPVGQAMEFIYTNASGWKPTNGGVTMATASNGLTAISGNVKLGGQLNAATTVDLNANDMIFNNGNVGISPTTINPGTSLDVGGAITNRETVVPISSNAAAIAANISQVRLTGAATGLVAIAVTAPPNSGQRLVIFNNTTGGFSATLNGFTIPNGQAMEFVYSNSNWRATNGGITNTTASNGLTATSGNITLGGTLSAATTVGLNGNNMTFTGSGSNITGLSNGNMQVGDASKNITMNLNNGTEPLLQLKPTATSNQARLGTSGSPLAIVTQGSDGTSTTPALFVNNNGNIGMGGTTTPGSTLQVNGSIAGKYRKVTGTNYAMTSNDFYVTYGSTTSDGTINLPVSTSIMTGRLYFIKNTTATFTVTINPAGSETIDGAASIVLQPGFSVLLVNTDLTGANPTWEVVSFSAATTAGPLATGTNGITVNAASASIGLGGTLNQPTTISTNGNPLTITSNTNGATDLVFDKLAGGGNQQLGIDDNGKVGVFDPVDKQFATRTFVGANYLITGSADLHPSNGAFADGTALNSNWVVGFSNLNKTLKVASPTSSVFFNICGGISLDAAGTGAHTIAFAVFVDNQMRSVKSIPYYPPAVGASSYPFSLSGSITGLSSGQHNFVVAFMVRSGAIGSTFFVGSNGTSLGAGGLPEFANRISALYNVID